MCTIAPATTLSPMPVTAGRRVDAGLLQEPQVERHPADVRRRDPVDERRRHLRFDVGDERQRLRDAAAPDRSPPRRRSRSDIRTHTISHGQSAWPSAAKLSPTWASCGSST